MHALILNLLLSAALLAHTVLGCCWHHGHAEACGEATVAPATHCHGDHATDDCGSGDHGAAPVVDATHDHSIPCDEPDCTFVKSGGSKPVVPQAMSLAVLLPLGPEAGPARPRLECAAEHGSAPVSGAALRALLQVWLT